MGNQPQGTTNAAGEASGKHQGLRQPANDERAADALGKVGLDDRGEAMEDHLRDRHGKGVRGGYDDSIDHDAGTGPYAGNEARGSSGDKDPTSRQ